MMKSFLCTLMLTGLPPLVSSFSPCAATGGRFSALYMTKANPAGRPNTDQVDEDMAMWFEEDAKGNRKKALKKPIAGRPVDLYTKKQVEQIEKKGVSPFEKVNRFGEWLVTRPTRGY